MHAHWQQWFLPTAVTLSQCQRSTQSSCSIPTDIFGIQLHLNLASLPVTSVSASKKYHLWYLYFPHNLFTCCMVQYGQYYRLLKTNFRGVQTGKLARILSWRKRVKLKAVIALCFIHSDTMKESTDILTWLLFQVMYWKPRIAHLV